MSRKTVSAIMVSLLVLATVGLVFNVQPVKSDYAWMETIYIQADGSIVPSTAPISSVDNVTYTLTDNIAGNVPAYTSAIIIQRDNIIIDGAGYTLQGTQAEESKGIYLMGRSNVTIKNMKITTFQYGIWLYSSSNNNSVSGNNVTNNVYGIFLQSSNNNSVSGNNVTANNWYGIYLGSSSNNNSVSGNSITATNWYGIYLDSSSNNSMNGNNITANNEMGIYLQFSANNSMSGNNITNNYEGIGLIYSSNNNSISGNNVTTNDSTGIGLYSSSNNSVSGNNVTNNSYGIYLDSSSNNSVSGNNVTNNYEGIGLSYSSNNSVSGNNVTASNSTGIGLDSSSNNSVSGNNVTNNVYDIFLQSSNNNSVSGNNVTANNWYGIYLGSSSNNNSVSGNNVTANFRGIWLYSSSNNKFYHNNFLDNTQQTYSNNSTNIWDDGYPSGGNYGSDYSGTDLYQGTYQNETGNDGMGDAPYTIDANNTDHYPLMNPWSPPDIAVTNLASAKTVIGQGYTVSVNVTFENLGNKIEAFNATICANETSIDSETLMLTMGNSTIVGPNWNTSGFAYGNYTLSASASILEGDTNIANNFNGCWVVVTIPGDINGDFKVSLSDLSLLAKAYGTTPASPKWNPNADINGDGKVSLSDLSIMAKHYNQHYP